MRQSKSSQDSTLSTHYQHLFSYSYSTDNILTLFGVIELVHIVDLVDIWLIVNKPTYLSAHLAISYLS